MAHSDNERSQGCGYIGGRIRNGKVSWDTLDVAVQHTDNQSKTNGQLNPTWGRVANGVPNRVDRLKQLGNAIVPPDRRVSRFGGSRAGENLMSAWLIGGIAVIYLLVAVNFLFKQQYGMALTFLGFCLGNLGLALEAMK